MDKNSKWRGFPHRKIDVRDSAEADRFADAVSPVELDAIGEMLIDAALYAEKHEEVTHPFEAIREVSPTRTAYYAGCKRVHDACGLDNSDLSIEERIDTLVAAAYWEVP